LVEARDPLAWRASPTDRAEPLVSVVFPCLDEVEAVGRCVRRAREAMADAGLTGEVLVVDNGSSDGSREAAAATGARVLLERRRGYGAALSAGIASARGEVVVIADADGTYDLWKIPEMARRVLDGEADLVVASRLPDSCRTIPALRRLVGVPLLNFLVSRASGLALADSQSGFRSFRRDAMLALCLQSRGMEFASEMLVRAARAEFRIVEVAGAYEHRVGRSKLRTFADGWRHVQLLTVIGRSRTPRPRRGTT
jgi:glycosyltransferase involved in cell wall biosynthesis